MEVLAAWNLTEAHTLHREISELCRAAPEGSYQAETTLILQMIAATIRLKQAGPKLPGF